MYSIILEDNLITVCHEGMVAHTILREELKAQSDLIPIMTRFMERPWATAEMSYRIRRFLSAWLNSNSKHRNFCEDFFPRGEKPSPVWCVAANIVHERHYGPGGAEIRHGTRHFASGAKVHVIGSYSRGKVTVVGRHRKSRKFITIIMNASHLANWRAELVYSPHVIRQIRDEGFSYSAFPLDSEHARLLAENFAAGYVKAGAITQPFSTRA